MNKLAGDIIIPETLTTANYEFAKTEIHNNTNNFISIWIDSPVKVINFLERKKKDWIFSYLILFNRHFKYSQITWQRRHFRTNTNEPFIQRRKERDRKIIYGISRSFSNLTGLLQANIKLTCYKTYITWTRSTRPGRTPTKNPGK